MQGIMENSRKKLIQTEVGSFTAILKYDFTESWKILEFYEYSIGKKTYLILKIQGILDNSRKKGELLNILLEQIHSNGNVTHLKYMESWKNPEKRGIIEYTIGKNTILGKIKKKNGINGDIESWKIPEKRGIIEYTIGNNTYLRESWKIPEKRGIIEYTNGKNRCYWKNTYLNINKYKEILINSKKKKGNYLNITTLGKNTLFEESWKIPEKRGIIEYTIGNNTYLRILGKIKKKNGINGDFIGYNTYLRYMESWKNPEKRGIIEYTIGKNTIKMQGILENSRKILNLMNKLLEIIHSSVRNIYEKNTFKKKFIYAVFFEQLRFCSAYISHNQNMNSFITLIKLGMMFDEISLVVIFLDRLYPHNIFKLEDQCSTNRVMSLKKQIILKPKSKIRKHFVVTKVMYLYTLLNLLWAQYAFSKSKELPYRVRAAIETSYLVYIIIK
ncbi:hypothetical protein AGLY_017308 [Aphis glycines]|uniref:Uncharacterized protein n=1 Tax=Aphis glycines TaxID=307491 RepID=A0A6G0SXB1_APHGL|nr:hypothetical protein AGLY_017308 [Aphis glycines]